MVAPVSHHLEPWHNLAEKVVLLTGPSSGLDLARVSCRVIAAARQIDRLESLDRLTLSPPRPRQRPVTVPEDSTRWPWKSMCPPAIDKHVQKAWDAFGHIDVLINNAGVGLFEN